MKNDVAPNLNQSGETTEQDETKKILSLLEGKNWLMGQLLYGAGLRIMECVRLRIKDIDFEYKQINVRDDYSAGVETSHP